MMASQPLRIGIVTRGDLFPPVHGAAVRIVRTAQALSLVCAKVVLVTDDAAAYVRYAAGRPSRVPYPRWLGLVPDGRIVREAVWDLVGIPPAERRLFIPVLSPSFWVRVAWVARAERLDILQAEFPFYAYPALFARACLGVRTSISAHNVEHVRIRETAGASDRAARWIRRLEGFACRRVQDVIAVSETDRAALAALGVPAVRIAVVPHGVDLAAFREPPEARESVRTKLGIAPTETALFFHGALHYPPNREAVAIIAREILPRLESKGVAARAVVAGQAPPLEHAHPGIAFTGVVEDLASHVAAADIAIVPLLRGGGTRMKVLEYLAARRPVVSTRKGVEGLPIVDGRQALVVPDGDWHAFAEGVARLAADPDERRRLGEAGTQAVQDLDWSEISRRLSDLYRQPRGPLEIARERWRAFVLPRLARPRGRLEEAISRAHERRAARGLTRAYLAHLARGETAPPPAPKAVILLLNRACNLRCRFCDLHGGGDQMPIGRVSAVLDSASRLGARHVVLTGGEPFLHPQLFEAIALAKRAGLGVNVTTNGTLVERNVDRFAASRLDSISISIDGLDGTHDELRGVPGALASTLRGIEWLRAESTIKIDVYFVVTHRNVHQLRPVHAFARSIGAEFGFWPVNECPDLYVRDPVQVRDYLAALEGMAREDPAVAARFDYHRGAVEYHAGRGLRVRCLGLVDQAGIDVEGNLLACCLWGEPSLAVGNVFQTPIEELWRAPRAVAARRRIFERGCESLCYNHSLYEFTQTTGLPFRLGGG